jgi:hypothetical protein
MQSFNTPILFLVFNRPANTQKVFEAIKSIKPTKLYIAADGPRKVFPEDYKRCNQVRKIVSDINWNCQLKTLFRKNNLGCRHAISSAIDWFFEREEEGIILEDDCLPDISFFKFCREMLEIYRNDNRIAMISGSSLYQGNNLDTSYYFTKYPVIWGWASWSRVWKNYNVNMSTTCHNTYELIKNNSYTHNSRKFWKYSFNATAKGYIDTWDYQFVYTCWKHGMTCIAPGINLISNIGFGTDSTNTVFSNSNLPQETMAMKFPLTHPNFCPKKIEKIDKSIERKHFWRNTMYLLLLKNYGLIKKIGILNFVKKITTMLPF